MQDNVFQNWLNSSYLSKSNQEYINKIYEDFLKYPSSVGSDWNDIFHKMSVEKKCENQLSTTLSLQSTLPMMSYSDSNLKKLDKEKNVDNNKIIITIKVLQLINSFRTYGYQHSVLDPLKFNTNDSKNNFLKLEQYEFQHQDLYHMFDTALFGMKQGTLSVKDIFNFLNKIYCGSIGIEYMHILDADQVKWIQTYFESKISEFSDIEQKQFLKEIIASEGLERYLGTKFPGVKRFSLEGGDALIPMLKEIIRYSVLNHKIEEIFLGMAHRGRLNVLINIFGKNPKSLFNEFSNIHTTMTGSGDVKYHQGLYSQITLNGRHVHLSLLPNPSHLEIITPVVMGSTRSRIDQLFQYSKLTKNHQNFQSKILPITIHGDSAISAQGIVQESLNMSNTNAYTVEGMIHIIINNQIGFTTSEIHDMRSTPHCTDIAKMIQAPIIHVNSDDIHAVIHVVRFALNFRNKFKRDVIIDLVCYRRHGHNETDDPSVTQPMMYKKIGAHPTVTKIYSEFLVQNNIITLESIKDMERSYRTHLSKTHCLIEEWMPIQTHLTYYLNNNDDYVQNRVCPKKNNSQYLQKLANCINTIPFDILMHDRVRKIYNDRTKMALGKQLFDWGSAENLAYATLLDQGYSIRISGEDVSRGTFFHRHAVIHDQNHGAKYVPLMHIQKKQGAFSIWDSVLSEESVLAFEYGYASIASNNTLVIWEAQFGDFSNGAQIVIDQFISSSEQKWNQLCGLIMLLPHGYEGQGPEHSSCRIERYLQLCAEENIQICVPSTPAQIYHILLQQAYNAIRRKPLIIVSPKSLLRHPMATSSIEDLTYGSFQKVLHETNNLCILNQIDRVILCTGKVYYDLVNHRNQAKRYNTAIIRIEQLYPFPESDIRVVLKSYNHVKDFVWCQEEPKNQGAWYYIERHFRDNVFKTNLQYIGRPASAAPAVGYFSIHQQQQKKIIHEALVL